MAKLARESKLREKRAAKAARKTARKLEAENPSPYFDETLGVELGEPASEGEDSPEPAAGEPPSDA